MSCQEIENRILDYQENQLSPAQRAEVETHLGGCAHCRTLARQFEQLDAALSASVKAPALSADFDQRLWQRVQAAPAALTEAQRAERKRQLQAEFEAGLARIGRGSFALESLLRNLTWPALAMVAGWLAWRLTLALTAHLDVQGLGALAPSLLPWLAVSAVFLALGLAQAFPRTAKFLRFW
jgi:anti-sigma factor RsiW